MKIHIPREPLEVIRLTFRKKEYDYEYIILEDTSIPEVKEFLKSVINKEVKIDPFYTGDRIGIDIREYRGSKAGVSESVSFKDSITPIELKEVILKALKD